jgi:hypothetical protein
MGEHNNGFKIGENGTTGKRTEIGLIQTGGIIEI